MPKGKPTPKPAKAASKPKPRLKTPNRVAKNTMNEKLVRNVKTIKRK